MSLTRVEFHVLLALVGGASHGYAVMRDVETLTGGQLRIGPGTLYTAIKRLRAADLIERVRGGQRSAAVLPPDAQRQESGDRGSAATLGPRSRRAQARPAALRVMTPAQLYSAMLLTYPPSFRREYGARMIETFTELYEANTGSSVAFWIFVAAEQYT